MGHPRSRQAVVTLALAAALAAAGCTPPAQPDTAAPRTAADGPTAAPPLRTRTVGDDDGSGLVVILLHGYGAAGDDLVAFASTLDVPHGTRFVLPEAPLDARGIPGGHAWWPLDVAALRARQARDGWRTVANVRPPGLERARASVVALVRALAAPRPGAVTPRRVVLGGFSQGAMLAGDVAFESDVPLAGVAMMSGTPVAYDAWGRGMPRRARVPFLLTHGRADPLLPFDAAQELATRLAATSSVTFVPFDGGHTIAPAARDALQTFLRALAARP